MKITCEGCSAKYTVSDAKVAGRAFKIRCKRCGEAIVVRGDRVSAPAPAMHDGGWHAVIGDDQRGPFDAEALRTLALEGTIGTDTYVWKEGWAEWRPLGEVHELASLMAEPDPRADLFAQAPSAFAPDEVQPPAALTGTRNESSVLFSLSNLKSLSTGAPAPASAAPTAPVRSNASGDGSGLIDIRALAAASQQNTSAPEGDGVDDLLAIGSVGLGSVGSPLAPPVLVPAPRGGSKKPALIVALGAACVTVAAAAAAVAIVLVDESNTRAAAPPNEVLLLPPSPAAAPSESAVEAARPAEPETSIAAEPSADAEPPRAARAERPSPPRRARARSRRAPAPIAERPEPPREEPSISELIDEAVSDAHAPPRPRPVASDAPSTPSRADVVNAMNSVAGAVRACGDGARGLAPVRIDFGSDGRVQSAQVNAGNLPPEVRSCVARAVRAARVPRFTRRTFRVTYPFRL